MSESESSAVHGQQVKAGKELASYLQRFIDNNSLMKDQGWLVKLLEDGRVVCYPSKEADLYYGFSENVLKFILGEDYHQILPDHRILDSHLTTIIIRDVAEEVQPHHIKEAIQYFMEVKEDESTTELETYSKEEWDKLVVLCQKLLRRTLMPPDSEHVDIWREFVKWSRTTFAADRSEKL